MDDRIDGSAGNKEGGAGFLGSVEGGKFNFGMNIVQI